MFSKFKLVFAALTFVPQLVSAVEKLVTSVEALETAVSSEVATNPTIAAQIGAVRDDLMAVKEFISHLR